MLEARFRPGQPQRCDGITHLDGPWLRCGALGAFRLVIRTQHGTTH
jgi:hypothetical protein